MKDIIVKKRQIFNRYTSKSSHICIIWSSVGQLDNLDKKIVHLLTAKGGSSGPYMQKIPFSMPVQCAFVTQMSSYINV